MRRRTSLPVLVIAGTLAFCAGLRGAEKKAPQGQGEDETVAVAATLLNSEQLRREFGSDFDNNYTVLEIRLSPRQGKPFAVRLDDFILRSEATGEHSGPLVAAQIAGAGSLVVQRTYADRPNAESSRIIAGTKIEMKQDEKADPALDTLKKRILVEKTTSEPLSGLLFFPLSKEKPKNLILSFKTPQSHIRIAFK